MALADLFRPRWKHSDHDVRRAAVEEISDSALLARVARTDASDEIRGAAIRRMGAIGDVATLAACLGDTTQVVICAAATALGKSNDVQAIAPLLGLLARDDANLRKAAEAALDELRPAWKADVFAKAIDRRGSLAVNRYAMRALEAIGGKDAIRGIMWSVDHGALLKWKGDACEALALESLARMARDTVLEVIDETVRAEWSLMIGVRAAGLLGDARSIPFLMQAHARTREGIYREGLQQAIDRLEPIVREGVGKGERAASVARAESLRGGRSCGGRVTLVGTATRSRCTAGATASRSRASCADHACPRARRARS